MLLTLPDEVLELLSSFLAMQNVCRMSQTCREAQLWLVQRKRSCRFAWLHSTAFLAWSERAQVRAKHKLAQAHGRRQCVSIVLSSFARTPVPTQRFSASESERLFSTAIRMRCCFIPEGGNCCGMVLSVRNEKCLWAHLKSFHGVDEAAYLERARILGWQLRATVDGTHGHVLDMDACD